MNMKATFTLIALILTSFLSVAGEVSHVHWDEPKDPSKQINGKMGDEVVVIVPGENQEGVRELQMILIKGKPTVTITTRKGAEPDVFIHTIIVNKELPYSVQIDSGEVKGSVIVTISSEGAIVRRVFTDPRKALIGITI